MYLITGQGAKYVVDFDMNLLSGVLRTLDRQWTSVLSAARGCPDPDGFGYLDDEEYLAGLGFVACQRYISSTCSCAKISKKAALALPPIHSCGETGAALINAAANFWKHVDEWDTGPAWLHQDTERVIEAAGVTVDGYACSVILELLVGTRPRPFRRLRNALIDWRSSVIQAAEKERLP